MVIKDSNSKVGMISATLNQEKATVLNEYIESIKRQPSS